MPARSTARRKDATSPSKRRAAASTSTGRARAKAKVSRKADTDYEDAEESPLSAAEEGEEENESESEDDAVSLDSDALDEDEDDHTAKAPSKKRKRESQSVSPVKAKSTSKASPRKPTSKKRKKKAESDEEDDDLDLKEGQEVVGVVVQAPKTGRVPPGQISKNTFDFLTQLKKPECNDREWFKLHEPVYRLAEKEWKDFIEEFTNVLMEVDPQIPLLPPKDVIHRIYRDIRFSNDKTPYKTALSAGFSRSGRKGIFAAYYIQIKPGGDSLIAAGVWCPGKNELATLRNNIKRSSTRLRRIISSPEFVQYFGEPTPHPDGERRNIFGNDDELKVAPKGVDKSHKDIDLLKCRSFAVFYRFMDSEVLSPDFKDALGKVAKVAQPLVHCLNDMMTLQDSGDTDEEDGGSGEEDGD